jgi:hypothetical protein
MLQDTHVWWFYLFCVDLLSFHLKILHLNSQLYKCIYTSFTYKM